ncbi:MAG: hypothetical protein ACRD8Z_22320 [Nitrososphaeraceae archaeon]
MTNYGTAIVSPIVGSPGTINTHGKESVFSEDGDTTATRFMRFCKSIRFFTGLD